jgi:hypothetical protein
MPFAEDGEEGSPGQEPPGKSSHRSGLPCALHTVIHPQFHPTFQIAYFFLGGVAIVTISQITHIRNHSVTQICSLLQRSGFRDSEAYRTWACVDGICPLRLLKETSLDQFQSRDISMEKTSVSGLPSFIGL